MARGLMHRSSVICPKYDALLFHEWQSDILFEWSMLTTDKESYSNDWTERPVTSLPTCENRLSDQGDIAPHAHHAQAPLSPIACPPVACKLLRGLVMIPWKQSLLIQFFAYHHEANIIAKFCIANIINANILVNTNIPPQKIKNILTSSSSLPSYHRFPFILPRVL